MAALTAALPAVSAGFSILSGVKGLFGKEPKAPKEQDVTPPTVLPTQDSALVAEAKRRALIAQTEKGGRASTILTNDDDDSFGGN